MRQGVTVHALPSVQDRSGDFGHGIVHVLRDRRGLQGRLAEDAAEGLRREADEALGIPLAEGTAGGASDGSLTSRFVPTLDGLGAVGDGAHALHEHVLVDRMPERAALLALLLLEPQSGL